uniref:Uncharacterized protein n=1 Tax=Ananas comosus var. bracteatus TaxID=296719 RepID=A0A6V7PY13_ANACO|nr:unnamed protein product [Ananas comosus var. bracteatus]
MLAVPVQGYSVPVQATRTDLAALGLAPVPVQEPVYRYKGVGVGGESGWDFVADVAPRAVRARLLPELCEEAGRGSVFTVLDVTLRFDAVEVARSPRRNVGSRRGLVRWIRDFERNPRSPHLPDLVKLVHRIWRSPVDPAEVVLVRGFVRCLDLAFEVGYIGFTPKATGFGCCASRGSGSRQGRRELEPYPTDRARGTPTSGTFDASYTGEIPLYTADLSACPGNETSGA